MPSVETETQKSLERQAQLLKVMQGLTVAESIGVACSYLLYCVYKHPVELRRVLSDPVNREGFRGEPLIKMLARVARS